MVHLPIKKILCVVVCCILTPNAQGQQGAQSAADRTLQLKSLKRSTGLLDPTQIQPTVREQTPTVETAAVRVERPVEKRTLRLTSASSRSSAQMLNTQPAIPNSYQVIRLDGPAVACAAARNWSPSKALRARGRTIVRLYCDEDECSRKAAHALARFLNMQAAQQDDTGAATALRAYYARIGLAQQASLARKGVNLVAKQQTAQRALTAGGIASGIDTTALDRQLIQLQDTSAQVNSKDRQLDSLLQHIAGMSFAADQPGVEALEIWPQTLDCDSLVGFAHNNRQDLLAWIYLRSQINSETAPVIAKMFTTATGGFSLPLPPVGPLEKLFCGDDYEALAASMRSEMSCVIAAQRDWITKTVSEKCHELQLAYTRHDLSVRMLESWQGRLKQLEQMAAQGQSKPQSVAEAKSGLLAAQVEEVARRMEAKTAEVDLAEATGGLACRCCAGFPWLVTGL